VEAAMSVQSIAFEGGGVEAAVAALAGEVIDSRSR